MRIFAHLLVIAVVVTLGLSTAMAGSLEKGVYTSSHGYVIVPPAEWKVVDRSNIGVLKDQLPEALAAADASVYDVLFYDPAVKVPGEGDPAVIFDNIIILVVKPIPEADDTQAKALAAGAKVELSKLFSKVELVKSGKVERGDVGTMELEWHVTSEEDALDGYVLQSVFAGFERSLMVTCTIDAERYTERKAICEKTLESIKLNE